MNAENGNIQHTLRALKISVYDGIFAQSFATLTGTIFLPAFALALKASSFEIGLLASIPFFGTLSQIVGAIFIEKYQNRKKLSLIFASIARGLWIPLLIFSYFLSESHSGLLLSILIIGIIIYHIFAALSGVSWLSWMAVTVPPEIRGRYFGMRNSFLGLLTIIMTVLGGFYLDWFRRSFPGMAVTRAFEGMFLVAILCAAVSILFLVRQPKDQIQPGSAVSLKIRFSGPLKDRQFLRFLRFGAIWSFAVNFASPFFIVYMLQDLKLNYMLVSIFTVSSALADLTGMWAWGHFSDQIGNRPVIIITAIFATILPFLWIFTDNSPASVYIMLPLLHLLGGFMWAGYNLCSVNLIFGLAPEKGNPVYFAFWNSFNGIAAGLGAITGGIISLNLHDLVALLPFVFDYDLKLVFLASALFRLFALPGIRSLQEEQGVSMVKAIRVLRSIRSWATMMGFHPALHFFLPSEGPIKPDSPYWPLWRRRNPPRAEY